MTEPVRVAGLGLTRSASCRDLNDELTGHIERVGLDGLVSSLDRVAEPYTVPAHAAVEGFAWDTRDRRDLDWYPQGITTSGDAADTDDVAHRNLVVTSWYGKQRRRRPGKGARLSFVDYTDPDRPRYRHVLLVEPFRDPSSGVVDLRPVMVHAGGICWYGGYLYVAGTRRGITVFELDDLSVVPGSEGDDDLIGRQPDGHYSAYGYAFVLPQSFRYDAWSDEDVEELRYSFLSLDRTGDTHHLVAGEYGRRGATTRLIRYALDRETGLLSTVDDGHHRPLELRDDETQRMQGAVLVDGRYAITSSRGSRSRGDLWTGPPGDLTLHRGVLAIGPEDIACWPARRQLWTLTEWPTRRWVYALDACRWLTGSPDAAQ